MKRIPVSLVVVGVLSLVAAGAAPKMGDWVARITSDDERPRATARRELLRDRAHLIEQLLAVVRGRLVENEQFYINNTPRNTAMDLLGKYRSTEAVPVLTGWLVPRKGQSMDIDEESILVPAGRALSRIGSPALPHLLDAIAAEGTSHRGDQCLKVLVSIVGGDAAAWRLQRQRARAADKDTKARLDAALTLLSDDRFPADKLTPRHLRGR